MRVNHYKTNSADWNEFVDGDSCASIFHRLEWQRVIAQAYKHEAIYLTVEEENHIQGVLPLFLIRSRFFGRALVSLPFTDYGGILAKSAAASAAILNEALSVAKSVGADYLQLRQRAPLAGLSGIPAEKVTMLLGLSRDPEEIWTRLPSERRNRIKKAKRAGLIGRFVGADDLQQFYRVFSENMRDIGSPVHSFLFFQVMMEELGSRARVLLVEHSDKVIGAAVCLFFRDTIYIPWVSSLRRCFSLNPNMVLYWTAIEYACNQGFRTLDFGRSSRNSGTLEFKRQWGAELFELGWQSFPLNGGAVPSFAGKGQKERFLIECWKRLPLGVSNILGPWVRRQIPA